MSELVELLFFDTFAHDNTEELNLDLVQFPKPVYVTEVRIIPLGARVQADFPGGVRLGATNPSQFQIEFFVNDLGKPGASTFETLGGFEYDQNGCINLDCIPDESIRKIPTDGLVLRGWYTTITLAVYGTLTNNITEQIVQPVVNPSLPTQPNTIADAQQIISAGAIESEWPQETTSSGPIEYNSQSAANYQTYNQPDSFSQEFSEYYNDVPKDPRSYHHTPETEWEGKARNRDSDRERDRDRDRNRDVTYPKTGSLDRGDHTSIRPEVVDRRERERRYSRSESRDRERPVREYREISRDRDWSDRDHERQDYRSERDRDEHWNESERDRAHDRDRGRDRRHDESYRRSERYREDREERKRPRTPPMVSPKRPHTPPHSDHKEMSPVQAEEEIVREEKPTSPAREAVKEEIEEATQMDLEEFEPILSDEDILDDTEHYQEIDYDYSTYTNNDDIIKLFTPGVTDLQNYAARRSYSVKDNAINIEESLKTSIGIADDYLKSSITRYVIDNFQRHNTEIKEEFIHLCEKLISTVGPAETFQDIAKLYTTTRSMSLQTMSLEDKEITAQVSFIIETVTDWLRIALNYEMANAQEQPAYKIRHIKCGVRLAEWCCSSENFVKYLWQKKFNIHKELMNLYDQEFMALSVKLMILKALDAYLMHKFAVEKFLQGDCGNPPKENGYHDSVPIRESNGYKILVENMLKNPLVRLKFALNSILQKLNLYEVLHKVHSILIKLRNVSHDISAEEINLITKSLNQILIYCQSGPFTLSQPKRFLPVSSQFEILRSETKNIIVQYFKMFNLLQCFILLLTYPSTLNLPPIKTPIFEIVSHLLETSEGLKYLSENIETMNVLLKCLLRTDEEMQYSIQDCIEIQSHNLGLVIAYKLQARYHIECLMDIGEKFNFDCDAADVLDQLHGLFCLAFSHVGKVTVAEILGMDDNVRCLLQFLDNFKDVKSEGSLLKLKKSPGIAYILDLLSIAVMTVPNVNFLEKNSKTILHVVNLLYDDTLSELRSFLVPLENVNALTYDNISSYLDIIEKLSENAIFNYGPIITSLRIIQHLGISQYCNKAPILSENPLSNYIELKYKHVILQLFSLDGMALLTKLLQRICAYFEQPSLHSSMFVSSQGLHLVSIIHPSILLLKQMLAYVIQCQNTNFKDLTAIPVLLQTYNLLNSYSANSAGYQLAQKSKIDIVDTLLVYTQPLSQEVHEKDSLNRTLWTQMMGEVIRYVTSAPHTFVSGLLIFSELLPLPLPIQTIDDLSKEEISWAINLRKLWSAHLHPHTNIIQEMINRLCISTQPQLLNLLRRICVQLSDLAANSALMIARGILDSVYEALVPKEDMKIGPCNSHVARLLNFLACLVTHGTIKCAVLHLIHTNSNVTSKTEEKYATLIPAFAQVLKNNCNTNSHIQAQECILSVVQSFCDIEITLLQNSVNDTGNPSSEVYLANSVPVKECLLVFINIMLDHLSTENSFVTYLPIVRTLLLLSEHDYGFYHLKENLLKRNQCFSVLLNKLANNFSKSNAECLSTLNTLVEFLRICLATEEEESNPFYTPRSITLSLDETKGLIGWNCADDDVASEKKHHLVTLEDILKKVVEEDNTFESLLEGVTSLLKLLENNVPDVKKENVSEIILPSPETLLTQFSSRTIFSSSDACDERLTDRYWLAIPTDEGEGELDNVSCDLIEICRQNLSQDYNIIKELEKLCRICRTETLDDKEKRIDDQKLKMKKPFVTPMRARGFARTVQQRPDLFRSRPPNTSRPPSLHVDDFVALETCGAQPTGPTGYNKISRELLASTRVARGTRGRAFVTSERSVQYNRQMPWWGAGIGRGPYQM